MENQKKQKIKFSVIVAVIMLVTFFGGYFVHYAVSGENTRTINEILDLIESKSVTVDGILTTDVIADGLVSGVLNNDDYADYYGEKEYQSIIRESDGYYKGIGMQLYSDAPTVFSVTNNSPAEKAGIKKDDTVTEFKRSTETQYQKVTSSAQVTEFIENSEVGDVIDLKVIRNKETKEFRTTVNTFVASYVRYYDSETEYSFVSYDEKTLTGKKDSTKKMSELPNDTAYIKFSLFEGKADDEFAQAMKFMAQQNRTKLILDLRDNLGGYMTILTNIASYLIDANGKMTVAIAKEKDGQSKFETSDHNFNKNIKKITVIANGYTASAAECLIGAMMCYGSGNFNNDSLILTKNHLRNDYSTYGKGIMQTTFRLSGGGALKLTTAYIYWPNGETCIHGKGIKQVNALNQVTDETAIERAVAILNAVSQ